MCFHSAACRLLARFVLVVRVEILKEFVLELLLLQLPRGKLLFRYQAEEEPELVDSLEHP